MELMQALLERLMLLASSGGQAVFGGVSGMFAPSSRFFLPYLLVGFVIAAIVFAANRKQMGDAGKQSTLRYLFDPRVYFNQSSLVDLKVTFANRLFAPFLAIFQRGAIFVSAYWVASLFTDMTVEQPSPDHGLMLLSALTVVIMLSSDFTTYWVHRLHHELPALWPFHRLHHSAEALTPLTFARKHPVYDLTRALSNIAVVGPVQGLVFGLFGVSDAVTILGVNIVTAVFFWSGANLRHSHVWVSYGPVLNRIFISPAQHQIHHSCAARHHDTNYGEIFALWDWMFGTLYNPKGFEALEFGVADADGNRIKQLHPTLKDAYLEPFSASFTALAAAREPESAPNASSANSL